MKKLDKEKVINYATYVAGLYLVLDSVWRLGANDVKSSLKKCGWQLVNTNGVKAGADDIKLPSRIPFKK